MKVGEIKLTAAYKLNSDGSRTKLPYTTMDQAMSALENETKQFLIDNNMNEYDSFEEYWEAVRTALIELGFRQDPDKDTVHDNYENSVMAVDSAKAFAETWAD